MTGVIYARYSSDNQREESIEGQLRECKAYAEKNDIQIVGTYIDRAYSAKTDNRPEFQHMIKDSAKKLFDIALVWKLDRFARNRYDSANYKNILKKNGVRLLSATENIGDSPEGIILESVIEGMAEYYSVELREKVIRGQTENALKCKFNGGSIPFGYIINVTRQFEIDPLAAPFVLEAFREYNGGSQMKDIAASLRAKGMHYKNGSSPTISKVSKILKNRRYIGEYAYRDIFIPDGIPAIVPRDLFDSVQEKLRKNNRAPARKKADEEYILTTKLYCGDCMSFMVGESGTSHNGNVHRYYKCVSAKKRRGCHKKAVRKEWIEDIVVNQTVQIINDEDMVNDLIEAVWQLQKRENTAVPRLSKQLDETQKGINNLVDAIQQGILTSSTKQRLDELEERKKELESEIAEERISKPLLTKENIRKWFEAARSLDPGEEAGRKKLIEYFVNAVILYDDRIEFKFNYKDSAKTLTIEELKACSDMVGVARSHSISFL